MVDRLLAARGLSMEMMFEGEVDAWPGGPEGAKSMCVKACATQRMNKQPGASVTQWSRFESPLQVAATLAGTSGHA